MKKQVAFILSLCILLSSVVIQTEIIANAYTFEKEVNMAYTGVLYDTNKRTQGTVLCIEKIATYLKHWGRFCEPFLRS